MPDAAPDPEPAGAPDATEAPPALVGFAVVRADGMVLYANHAFHRLLGRSEGTIEGQRATEVTPAGWHAGIERRLAHPEATSDEPLDADWHRPANWDEASRFLAVTATTVTATASTGPILILTAVDDTGARLAELAAAGEVDELADRLGSVAIGALHLDGRDRVSGLSPPAESLAGVSPADLAGTELGAVLDPPRPERRPAGTRSWRAALKTGSPALPVTATTLPDPAPGQRIVLIETVDETGRDPDLLRAAETRFRTLARSLSDTISLVDREGRVRYTTGQLSPVLGYDASFWAGRDILDLAHPHELEEARAVMDDVLARPGAVTHGRFRVRDAAGAWHWLELVAHNLVEDPTVGGVMVTTRNITEQQRTELALSHQARVLELTATGASLDEALGAVADLVGDGSGPDVSVTHLRVVNGSAVPRGPRVAPLEVLQGLAAAFAADADGGQLVGENDPEWGPHSRLHIVADPAGDPRVVDQREDLIGAGFGAAWWLTTSITGAPTSIVAAFPNTAREPDDAERTVLEQAASLSAIILERHATRNELVHRNLHDRLTGLPNRDMISERLSRSLSLRPEHPVTALFIDVDRFKLINDSVGHTAGDRLLVDFVARLSALVRPTDTIGRFGSDEFLILSDQADPPRTCLAVAQRLRDALRTPFQLPDGTELYLSVSMGLATNESGSPETLLRNAASAAYRAKEQGRNRVEFFDEEMRAHAASQLRLANNIRRAVENGEIGVAYQPVVDLRSGAVVGAEALARWHHSEHGDVGPAQFIPIVEEAGLIDQLGDAMLDRAVADAVTWFPGGPPEGFGLAVNLSPHQLNGPDLVSHITARLKETGWPASALTLELTETEVINQSHAIEVMEGLRRLGVRLAVDDFGTGYSSLTYLHRLPFDVVKIDQTFIADLDRGRSSERTAIVRAAVSIADALGLAPVAEGVERPGHVARLWEMGCHLAQGFLFAEAMDADAFRRMLADGPPWLDPDRGDDSWQQTFWPR